MRQGTVYQRHLKSCPRGEAGAFLPHRCRGSWGYVFDQVRPSSGKRVQQTKSGFPTKAAAKAALEERIRLFQGEAGSHALTVGQYLEQWLAGKHSLKPATLANYRDLADGYLVPNLGKVKLLQLQAQHLDQMYAGMTHGRRGTPLSPATIRRVHAVLRSALNTAVKRRLIPYSPADHIELARENPKRPRPWSAEQCGKFLESIEGDHLACLYELLIVTGLRRGEAVGLRWEDVSENCMAITIVQQIVAVRGHLTVGSPKTKRGVRAIPLDSQTAWRMRQHRRAQELQRHSAGLLWQEHGLVFTQPDGRPIRPEFVTKHFKALTRRAGLPAIRLHDLRHTSASLALEAGVALKVVSERLGHSQTAITADLYTHVSGAVAQGAADQIAALVPRASRRTEVSEKLAPSPETTRRRPTMESGTNEAPGRVSAAQGPDP